MNIQLNALPVWYEMFKRATAYKDQGDIKQAISVLQNAKALMIKAPQPWEPVANWLKLPMYLSVDKQYDEALSELQWLLATIDHRTAKTAGSRRRTAAELKHFECWERWAIIDKMRVVQTRAKRPDMAAQCAAECQRLQAEIDALRIKIDEQQRKRRDAARAKRKQ